VLGIIPKRLLGYCAMQNIFSDVLFTICRTNYSSCALMVSGKGDVSTDEKPNDGNKRKEVVLDDLDRA
jgi:hypothetical protein